jgi:hypothetical protein
VMSLASVAGFKRFMCSAHFRHSTHRVGERLR